MTQDNKGHTVDDCLIGLKVCYQSCNWWDPEKQECSYQRYDFEKILVANLKRELGVR